MAPVSILAASENGGVLISPYSQSSGVSLGLIGAGYMSNPAYRQARQRALRGPDRERADQLGREQRRGGRRRRRPGAPAGVSVVAPRDGARAAGSDDAARDRAMGDVRTRGVCAEDLRRCCRARRARRPSAAALDAPAPRCRGVPLARRGDDAQGGCARGIGRCGGAWRDAPAARRRARRSRRGRASSRCSS
jgi:hypothetical protein